jgi:hypothetical protein
MSLKYEKDHIKNEEYVDIVDEIISVFHKYCLFLDTTEKNRNDENSIQIQDAPNGKNKVLLKWSKELPISNGWYGLYESQERIRPRIVKIDFNKKGKLLVFDWYLEKAMLLTEYTKYQNGNLRWLGPLP